MSVETYKLSGHGVAFTLTVKECPASSEAWQMRVKIFAEKLVRLGAVRWQVLTEWQKRGVPHLHGICYFEKPVASDLVVQNWLSVARLYGPKKQAQDAKNLEAVNGWLMYLAKHSARGVRHYQRQEIPAGWLNSGRMWRKGGQWPVLGKLMLNERLADEDENAVRRLENKAVMASVRSAKPKTNKFVLSRFGPQVADAELQKRLRPWRKTLSWTRRLNRVCKTTNKHGETTYIQRGLTAWLPAVASLKILVSVVPGAELIDSSSGEIADASTWLKIYRSVAESGQ